MSAAHELIERGFEVEIFEKQPHYVGGKARSTDVPNTAESGKKPLPGEHGFRFFPGFYKHVTDTMKRIPFKGNRNGVYDNLVATQRIAMGREGMNEIISLVNFPKSVSDLKALWNSVHGSNTGLTSHDMDSIADKVWQLMTSCYDRRLQEYERLAWWEFTDADMHSEAYHEFFVGGITRTLVAAKPRKVSTRTGGDILLQLLFQMSNPFTKTDRVLNGPTNEAWLYPWRDYLLEKGVKYHHDCEVRSFDCTVNQGSSAYEITGMQYNQNGETKTVKGDYYIAAVPVEVMGKKLLTPEIKKADPQLTSLEELADDVAWMTGMQFYLKEDVRVTKGHIMLIDSPWGITAISQPQFWEHIDLSEYGHGNVNGIISVDISDWEKRGYNGKMAKECTKQEIMEEVWCQLVLGLRDGNKPLLSKNMVVACNLDRDIQDKAVMPPGADFLDVSKLKDCSPDDHLINPGKGEHSADDKHKPFVTIDKEPLLVNRVKTWELRPDAYCNIGNLMFASDYVRTYTDLATMEGANEAARRAVNAILDLEKSSQKKCKVWNLHEPWLLWPFRYYDKRRFKKGLPWNENFPWLFKLVHWLMRLMAKILRLFTKKS